MSRQCSVLLLSLFVLAAHAWECPAGWSTYSYSTPDNTTLTRCAQTQLASLPHVDTEFFCNNILKIGSGLNSYVAHSASVSNKLENDAVLQIAQIAFSLQKNTSVATPMVFIGGAAGFGTVSWFDGTNWSGYANFASNVDSTDTSGCIGMLPDGTWTLVSCSDPFRPFVCAFTLTEPMTEAPTPAPTTPPPTPAPTSAPPTAPPQRATRPPLPDIAPPCLTGWSYAISTGKCYQLQPSAATMNDAHALCRTANPKSELTSILDEAETTFLTSLLAQSNVSMAFAGGGFMDSGNIGAWFEDNLWYNASGWGSDSTSSPSWPTKKNGLYTNWGASEPSLSYGCVAVQMDGTWVAQSCQSRLPSICSYIDDGSTFPPTSAPPTTNPPTTPAPITNAPVRCESGWVGSDVLRRCYKLVGSDVAASTMEAACGQQLPTPNVAHAAAPSNEAESLVLTSMVSASTFSYALLGISFVNKGDDGMYMDGLREYDALFVSREWAINEPRQAGGCVAMNKNGLWYYTPCAAISPAFLCYYSADQYSGSTTVAPGGTPVPTAPPLPLGERVASLSRSQSIRVARGSVATYSVESAGGDVEGLFLLFAPALSVTESGCTGSSRAELMAMVQDGKVVVRHNGAPFAVVCVSQDGIDFVPSKIRVTVVDVVLQGFLPVPQSLFTPPAVIANYSASSVITDLLIKRRSSATLQVVTTGSLDSSALSHIRFSSSETCEGLYTVSGLALAVQQGGMIAFQSASIEPHNVNPWSDDRSLLPPEIYFVCVRVQDGSLFSRMETAQVRIAPESVELSSMFLSGKWALRSSTLRVPQFSSPMINLEGAGLKPGMSLLWSFDATSCRKAQLPPTFNLLEPSLPSSLLTITTIHYRMGDTDDNASTPVDWQPYVQLNLNQTGLFGVDLSLDSQTLYGCFAYSASEPHTATELRVIVTRSNIRSIAPVAVSETPAQDVVLNTGFSGKLALYGLDTSLWSTETSSNTQLAFAELPGGSAKIPPIQQQCANASLFYNQRALGLVTGNTTVTSFGSGEAVVIVPLAFFHTATTRRMRVCLSVPHPFDTNGRTFLPTTATLDIQPIQLLFVGKYGAQSLLNGVTTPIAVPEESDNLWFPLLGYGLRSDMTVFLSNSLCLSQARSSPIELASYLQSNAKVNISVTKPYDLPRRFRKSTAVASDSSTYLVLTADVLTAASKADDIFGRSRTALNVCLYAPQTRNKVYSTPFTLTVVKRRVQNITMIDRSPTNVVYGSYVDLLVEGFGLEDNKTVLVPAVDCAVGSTFLWRSAVALSPIPSVMANNTQQSDRYTNMQSGYSSWFLPLNQAQTARTGLLPAVNNTVTRFQWCVNYDRYATGSSFESTGLPYKLTTPTVNGFVAEDGSISKLLVTNQQHGSLGQWLQVALTGPLIDAATTTGNPIYLFLSEPKMPCTVIKNYLLLSNNTDKFIVAVDGKALFLPSHLTEPGTYDLCASFLYPTMRSTEANVEAALQFVDITGLTIRIDTTNYQLFTLNGTSNLVIHQGQETLITVDGLSLNNDWRLRISPLGDSTCSSPIGDLPLYRVFNGQVIFGNAAAGFYTVLHKRDTKLLPVGRYNVCFKGSVAVDWTISPVHVNVELHERHPTYYQYFQDEDLYDVARVNTVAPTKIAFPHITGEADTVNIVGTVGSELSLELWCYSGNRSTAPVPCGDNKRVMLVRPLEDPTLDPCFIDDEDEDWDNVRGPYIAHYSVVTFPVELSTAKEYPNLTLPWILCVETSADYWRRPTAGFEVQFVPPIATGFRSTADPVDNTTATFPAGGLVSANNGPQVLQLFAGDSSRVVYLNGYGIREGNRVRFGLNCTNNSADLSAMSNPSLFTNVLTIDDNSGSLLFPASNFQFTEKKPMEMCIAVDAQSLFVATGLYVQIKPTRIIHDLSLDRYNDQHAVTDLLEELIITPLQVRGVVDLTALRNVVVPPVGAQIMISSNCLFNSHGFPLIQVTTGQRMSINFKHTNRSTDVLRVCAKNPPTSYGFVAKTFTDTNIRFKVLNVTLRSISLHEPVRGPEADYDVLFTLFQPKGRDLLIPLSFDFSPMTTPVPLLDSLNDMNVLSFLQLAQFRIGKPCDGSMTADDGVHVNVGVTSKETATFYNGTVSVFPESEAVFHAPLRVPRGITANPWEPYSFCVSVDGGRHFFSAGIAYISADWDSTLYLLGPQNSFAQNVTIFESSSVDIGFTDARFDGRVAANTADSYLDNALSRALGDLTTAALWTGFLGDVGYAEEGTLYIPSEVIVDNVNASGSVLRDVLADGKSHPLQFMYDAQAAPVNTGVTVTLTAMNITCLDSSIVDVLVNKDEPSRHFALDTACNVGVSDGAMLRLAPSCDNPSDYLADLLVDSSMNLQLPPLLPFYPSGTWSLCLKKYLPHRFAVSVKSEAAYVKTAVTVNITRTLVIDEVNGKDQGVLVGYQGDEFAAVLTGPGIATNPVVITFVKDRCEESFTYVDSNGTRISNDTLQNWFVAEDGLLRISSAVTKWTEQFLVWKLCFSIDYGLTFRATPLMLTIVPPTVSGFATSVRPGAQLYDPTSTTASTLNIARFLRTGSDVVLTESPTVVSRSSILKDYFYRDSSNVQFLGPSISSKTRRAEPLVGALVRSSISKGICNGVVSPSMIIGTFPIDANSGAANITAALQAEAVGVKAIVCVSGDGGATFFSGSARFPIPTNTVVVVAETTLGGNRRLNDLALQFVVQLSGTACPTSFAPPRLNTVAAATAAASGVDLSQLVMTLSSLPNSTLLLTARFLWGNFEMNSNDGALRLLYDVVGDPKQAASITDGLSPEQCAASVVGLNITYNDGVNIRGQGNDNPTVQQLSLIPYDIIHSTLATDTTPDDLQPKATWSVVPIILILPFVMIFATYHIYRKYFAVVTAEEMVAKAAEDERSVLDWLRRKKKVRQSVHFGDAMMTSVAQATKALEQ